jgi:hypothetical protein
LLRSTGGCTVIFALEHYFHLCIHCTLHT